jgi:putative ABC transport system substrate-binding protein
MPVIETAVLSFGMQIIAVPIRASVDIDPGLASFTRQPNGGLMLLAGSFTRLHQKLITDLIGRYRLPSISQSADFAKDGGLMSYGPNIDLVGQSRQAATYVDLILKGSKPGELPLEAPTDYRLALNLKTAKALGLTVSTSMQLLADEVIE